MNPDKPKSNIEGIIELTQVVKSGQGKDSSSSTSSQPLSTEDLTRFDERDKDLSKLVRDVVEDLPKDEPTKSGSAKVPMEQVEAALERVVTKLYSKKIEAMVMDTIEKTVQAEIRKIKGIIKEMAGKGPS